MAEAPGLETQADTGSLEIDMKAAEPLRGGTSNDFEVTVNDEGGAPVTDAAVTVELFMPAMPAMNMAEMRNTVELNHETGGRYRGTGNVMMAGAWEATVRVRRDGAEIGRRQFAVTAQ